MANLKLTKGENVKNEDMDVIPDSLPDIGEEVLNQENGKAKVDNSTSKDSYVKPQEVEGKKLFANKKANIALAIAGGVMAVVIVAAIVFVYLV